MFAALVLSLSFAPAAAAGAANPAAPAAPIADPVPVLDEDANVDIDYDLAIDLADNDIDVDMDVEITYVKPQELDGNRIVRFSMTGWNALLPSSASDIVVADSGGPLEHTLGPVDQPGLALLEVDFRRNLSTGESLNLSVAYSLKSDPPPVDLNDTVELILEDQVVVNDAVAAWAFYSDPRADTWSADFTLPPGFSGPLDDQTWERRRGTRTLETAGDSFVHDFIVVENDRAMKEHIVPFEDNEITVRYWPDDGEWRSRVSTQIRDNLPKLVDLVGQDWPDRLLVVQQSAQTLGTSYGGWYTSGDHRITIGRSINPELVLHELSHVWLHYGNLEDRWLIEGLADELAALAAHGPAGGPKPIVSPDEEFAFDLGRWVDPDAVGGVAAERPETERWAYQAAWHVVRTTREAIGTAAFTEVTRSFLGGTPAYVDPEIAGAAPVAGRRTWREFLDLAADRADDDEVLSDVYATWIEGGWTEQLQARSTARSRYRALQQRVGESALPIAVRRPMQTWDFTAATEAMEAVERFAERSEALDATMSRNRLSMPTDLESRLAQSSTVEEIDDYERELLATGDELLAFVGRVEQPGRWEWVGLLASDLEATRRAASVAFAAGDFSEAARLIADGTVLLDGARSEGRFRVGVAMATVSVLGLGLWLRPRRPRRGRRTDPGGHRRSISEDRGDDRVESDAHPVTPEVVDLTGGHEPSNSSSDEMTTSQRS